MIDTLFFLTSKLTSPLIKPETWIILGLILISLALYRGSQRLAQISATLTLAFTLAMAVFPLGEFLLLPLESKFPVNPQLFLIQGIVVAGGAEDFPHTVFWGQTQLNESAERLTATLTLAKQFPDARILIAGGFGEAEVAERFLKEQGIEPERLVIERTSRNTAENAKLGFELARPSPYDNWVLVTSAFHMPRALRSFKRAGWVRITPYPVDFRSGRLNESLGWNLSRNLELLNAAIKEYVGSLVYAATRQ